MIPDVLAYGPGWGDELLVGLSVTVGLAAVGYALGIVLGLLAALVEVYVRGPAGVLIGAWNMVFRSVPELLVIFVLYYGLSIVLRAVLSPFGVTGFVSLGSFGTGVLAIALIVAAYAAEVFSGAIRAVPSGPQEAARALGLPPHLGLACVTLPLAVRLAMPGLVNLSIVTLKITPLVSAIGLQDLIRVAGDAGRNTKDYLTFYAAALLLYLLVAAALYAVQLLVERRLGSAARGLPRVLR